MDLHSCSYYCDKPGCIKSQRNELRDRLEASQRELLGSVELHSLLARIHKDEGQYVVEHGLAQACNDADAIVANANAHADGIRITLEAEISRLGNFLDKLSDSLVISRGAISK